ncbi:MAG: hypothetical protein ACD_2C00025G0012 [uncultured bacterium (gcode 4)]|uniref:Uncharacterized protein n=1 Tax=uncultured bacterium (gcode 4) TaxID=1234023 RepID=K2FGF9_9BACT|nr:MAG: hypothetical protein ACD_2C00025G0012 [uncultured bacterium (gcode 4)]
MKNYFLYMIRMTTNLSRDNELSLIEKFMKEKQEKTKDWAVQTLAPTIKETQDNVKLGYLRVIVKWEEKDEGKIREYYFDRLVRGKFYLANQFKNKYWNWMDFTEEIKRTFIYLLETGWLQNVNYASRLLEEVGKWVDFADEVKKHEANIRKAFYDICMRGFMIINGAVFENIDFTDEIKTAFADCFEQSKIYTAVWLMADGIRYWIPAEFFKGVIAKNWKKIKRWFLFHLKKGDFPFAADIKDKLWEWLDFSDELIKWYDYFVLRSDFDQAAALQKYFWEAEYDKEVKKYDPSKKPAQQLRWSYIPPSDREHYQNIWAI